MELAECSDNAYGQAQEPSNHHGRAKQSVERLAGGILEYQHGPVGVAHEIERPHRPRPVELIP